jgi:hypothetical protein
MQDESLLQPEGKCGFGRHADFLTAGEQLGQRAPARPRQSANAGASSTPENRAHEGSQARASPGPFGGAAVHADTALVHGPPGALLGADEIEKLPRKSLPHPQHPYLDITS